MTKKILMAFVFIMESVYGLYANSDIEVKAVQNVNRAMAVADAAWTTSIKGSDSNLYMADTYNVHTGQTGSASDVWPYTAAIEAHCSILEALDALKEVAPDLYDEKYGLYKSRLGKLIDNLEYYQGTYRLSSYATSNKEWSPYAVPRANTRGKADVTGILNVYDDQMWLARELIRAYRLTENKSYLEKATYLTDYVLEGWDCWHDENGNEYGGITWGPGYNSKHACSNAPVIQPLVWLSDIYKDSGSTIEACSRDNKNKVTKQTRSRTEHYLDYAKKIYDWQKSKLQHSSGVYWDMMGADNTIQVSRGYRQHVDCGGPTGSLISYNTGTMISGASELYRVTQNPDYKTDLSNAIAASVNQFAKYVRKLNTYEFKTDQTAENGFTTWFNDVLMRSYIDADPYNTNTMSKNGLNSFQTTLDYAFENHNRNNLLPIHLIDGWGNETLTKAFHQFAFASEYAMLATWLMSSENGNSAITSVIADSVSEKDNVFSLHGIYLGTLQDIRVYIN